MLLSNGAIAWTTAFAGVSIFYLIKHWYKDYTRKLERDFIADYPEGTNETLPLALTEEEKQAMILSCDKYSFGEMTNPTPPRVETQYLGFKAIIPQPRARRIHIVRCNKHFAYAASRDGKYVIALGHFKSWIIDGDTRIVDGDVFYMILRFLNRGRHPPITAETHSPQEHAHEE